MPGGAMIGRYILTEHPLFGRRAKLIGDPGESAAANDKHARVVAWLHGGPLPPLDEDTRQKAPAPVLRLVEPPR